MNGWKDSRPIGNWSVNKREGYNGKRKGGSRPYSLLRFHLGILTTSRQVLEKKGGMIRYFGGNEYDRRRERGAKGRIAVNKRNLIAKENPL